MILIDEIPKNIYEEAKFFECMVYTRWIVSVV